MPNPYMQYQNNAVNSASSGDLLMMLYDGLVKFLKIAIDSMEKKNLSGANDALIRSQDILNYLDETLDERFDISKNLSLLYDFMKNHLVEANIKKDPQKVKDVLDIILDMRNTWRQASIMAKTNG
ncbi:MAG: flagellar export chaperone FliS [Bacillota bacterium]